MNLPAHETEWYEIHPRVFAQRPASWIMFTPDTVDELKQLRAYIDLQDAARRSTAIGPLFGRDIGSYLVTHPFDFWDFASAAIPTAEEVSRGEIRSFDEIYRDLERQVSDTSNYTTFCVLQGIGFPVHRIELEPGFTVEWLTSDEIKVALKYGLLLDKFGPVRSTFYVEDWNIFALKKLWWHPRRLGGEPVPGVGEEMNVMADISDEADRLMQCMALLTNEPVFVTGTLTVQLDHSFIFPVGDAVRYGIAAVPRQYRGINLDVEKCGELQRLWSVSQRTAPEQLKAFGLALRRLGYALQRTRPEDRLLDVYIAAEAFYLAQTSEPKERSEMRYRLSLRSAVWSDGTMEGWTRKEVFRQIRAGYDVRSAVAHGGSPDPADMKIKGERVPLAELAKFVQCIEDIVRAGLYKAFLQVAAGNSQMSIDWDALVLSEN
jgi:hypothetical protein